MTEYHRIIMSTLFADYRVIGVIAGGTDSDRCAFKG